MPDDIEQPTGEDEPTGMAADPHAHVEPDPSDEPVNDDDEQGGDA